jgi:hypothetical protein
VRCIGDREIVLESSGHEDRIYDRVMTVDV